MQIPSIYYAIKPLIPRRFQIAFRRAIAAIKRKTYLDRWPILPSAATPPRGWAGWPEKKKFALVLSHDVDTARGHDRCLRLMELEQRLGFFSSFNFVPEGYKVSPGLQQRLADNGFAIGVHGLVHDGRTFNNRKIFEKRATRINQYLDEWNSSGYHSPSMIRNLDWIAELNIEYDCSTFDTDPFEPQPESAGTIFPFLVKGSLNNRIYVELPYTLPQDHCLFIILKETDIRIWQDKLRWIAESGGMVFLNTHPDYMCFDGSVCGPEEYPVDMYASFLEHIKAHYWDQLWLARPLEVARYCKKTMIWRPPQVVQGAVTK